MNPFAMNTLGGVHAWGGGLSRQQCVQCNNYRRCPADSNPGEGFNKNDARVFRELHNIGHHSQLVRNPDATRSLGKVTWPQSAVWHIRPWLDLLSKTLHMKEPKNICCFFLARSIKVDECSNKCQATFVAQSAVPSPHIKQDTKV